MLDPPNHDWKLYESLHKKHRQKAINRSPVELLDIFQDLWSITYGKMIPGELRDRIYNLRWREKLSIRGKMVKAFNQLDEMRNGRTNR